MAEPVLHRKAIPAETVEVISQQLSDLRAAAAVADRIANKQDEFQAHANISTGSVIRGSTGARCPRGHEGKQESEPAAPSTQETKDQVGTAIMVKTNTSEGSPEESTWICDACTFKSPMHVVFCVMCKQLKKWPCDACTFVNCASINYCAVCSTIAPVAYRTQLPPRPPLLQLCKCCFNNESRRDGLCLDCYCRFRVRPLTSTEINDNKVESPVEITEELTSPNANIIIPTEEQKPQQQHDSGDNKWAVDEGQKSRDAISARLHPGRGDVLAMNSMIDPCSANHGHRLYKAVARARRCGHFLCIACAEKAVKQYCNACGRDTGGEVFEFFIEETPGQRRLFVWGPSYQIPPVVTPSSSGPTASTSSSSSTGPTISTAPHVSNLSSCSRNDADEHSTGEPGRDCSVDSLWSQYSQYIYHHPSLMCITCRSVRTPQSANYCFNCGRPYFNGSTGTSVPRD